MRFGNLPRQHQAHPAAARLGGKERHEQVIGIRNAWSLVRDCYDQRIVIAVSGNENVPGGVSLRLDGIARQIDQCLLELIFIHQHLEALRDLNLDLMQRL